MNAVVVGYGSIGPVHAKSISEVLNCNLYGICDVIKDRADSGASAYNAKAFYDYDECLKDENVDYVHICTPHYLHFEMIKKALAGGKKVVVEKPAVMKRDELNYLYENCDITKVFPIFQNRTNICIKELIKRTSDENETGKLKGVKAIVTWARGKEYYSRDDWHGTKAKEGGGVVINQALHTLDLMVLFGGKAKSVKSHGANFTLENVIEVEDTMTAFLDFENGARGIFFATNAYSCDSPVELELHYEKKVFSYVGGKLYENKEYICSDSDKFVGKKYWGNGHISTIGDLYDNGSTFCLNDIRDTMDVLFSMYENAEI